MQDGSDTSLKNQTENEEDLQAWCLLEESEKRTVAGGDQQSRCERKDEEGQSSVTVECGEQSQFESEEDCGGARQLGESQSHHGFWRCRSCDA